MSLAVRAATSISAFYFVSLSSLSACSGELNWTQQRSPDSKPRWSSASSSVITSPPLSWQMINPLAQQAANRPHKEPALAQDASDRTDKVTPKSPSSVKQPTVMGISRGITVNRMLYPDVSITVPSGFKRDPQKFLSLSLDATNQVRRSNFTGCRGGSSCPDAEFNAELALLQSGPASLELQYTVAGVFPDSNSSQLGNGQALGFRLAANISPIIGIAVGGDSLVNLDGNNAPVDGEGAANLKGRTLYVVGSAAIPLSASLTPPVLTVSAGAGSGYYGFNANGASDSQWGPFGSISYAFNDRIAVGAEYSGYAISAGVSLKPIKDLPLMASIYATDFLGSTPSYIGAYCVDGSCATRVLGRLTYSF
jgi:hypothetical protein